MHSGHHQDWALSTPPRSAQHCLNIPGEGTFAASLGRLFSVSQLSHDQTQKFLRCDLHHSSALYCLVSPQQSPLGSLERTPLPLLKGGLPRHLPRLYIFHAFNLSPQLSPSSPFIALTDVPDSSNLPAVMRCPVPSALLQVQPTRALCGGTAALLTHPRLFFSFFFFSLQWSSFKIKITRKGKATEIKI